MPDGSHGFSLLIIITAEFGPGIQLGFGFTLIGVGGLLGLNRTMQLAAAAWTASAPARSTRSCSRATSSPTRRGSSATCARSSRRSEGTFLIGPMAKLGWGAPTLVSLSLGVIIEIPGQHRDHRACCGSRSRPRTIAVLMLQVNFVGAHRVRPQARLLLRRALRLAPAVHDDRGRDGGCCRVRRRRELRAVASAASTPQFDPPPLPFPSPQADRARHPQRGLGAASAPRRTSRSPRTRSSSARAPRCSSAFSAVGIEGHFGFDALLQFSPFHFVVDISASFSVKVFGVGVFSVRHRAHARGPDAVARARHRPRSRSCSSPSASSRRHVGRACGHLLPPIAVLPMLSSELGKRRTGRRAAAGGANLLVSLRQLDPAERPRPASGRHAAGEPARWCRSTSRSTRSASQQPSDGNRSTIGVDAGALAKARDPGVLRPAQFQDIDDATKLSEPAYEPTGRRHRAVGRRRPIALGDAHQARRPLRAQHVDTRYRRFRRRFHTFPGCCSPILLDGASVSRSPLSQHARTKLRRSTTPSSVARRGLRRRLTSRQHRRRAGTAAFTSEAMATTYLARAARRRPRARRRSCTSCPRFEVGGA